MSTELQAQFTAVGPELTAELDELRYLVFEGMKGDKGDAGPSGADGPAGPAGTDGVSPTVAVAAVPGGHRVTITDQNHPDGQTFDVMDGTDSPGADSVVYLTYDSFFDDDPGITITSSRPGYATAAAIAPALANDKIRSVRFSDDYTFDVYDLVGYDTVSPETVTFACVKNNRIRFCVMRGTSGKPTYSSVPISGLPTVTASDNGKFLRVVGGAWAADAVPSAESASFGGGA